MQKNDKIQHPFYHKMFFIIKLSKAVIKGMYLNVTQAIYDKHIVNVILNNEKLKTFLRQEQDKGVHFHHFHST